MSRYDLPDPKCRHRGLSGFVSWPSILDPDFAKSAHVSTRVCDRTECIADAHEWISAKTAGHTGVYVSDDEMDEARRSRVR